MTIQKKAMGISLCLAAFIPAGLIIGGGFELASNVIFFVGIFFLLAGCFQFVGKSRLFARTSYGFSRYKILLFGKRSEVMQMKMETFDDYEQEKATEGKEIKVFFALAVTMLVLSFALALGA